MLPKSTLLHTDIHQIYKIITFRFSSRREILFRGQTEFSRSEKYSAGPKRALVKIYKSMPAPITKILSPRNHHMNLRAPI